MRYIRGLGQTSDEETQTGEGECECLWEPRKGIGWNNWITKVHRQGQSKVGMKGIIYMEKGLDLR